MTILLFSSLFLIPGVHAQGLSGVEYEVTESYESDESNSYENRCMGRSSDMVRYRYETRKYTEYKDGVKMKVWMKKYKKFLKCLG